MVEYFEPKVKDGLRLSDFWSTLFDLVLPIWPSRVTLPSHPTYPLGDIWPCKSLSKSLDQAGKERKEGDDFVPFHKLTQWLCYSLVDAIESETGWKVDKGLGQTGLPEVSTKQSFACLCRADNLRPFSYSTVMEGSLLTLELSLSSQNRSEATLTRTARTNLPSLSRPILPSLSGGL